MLGMEAEQELTTYRVVPVKVHQFLLFGAVQLFRPNAIVVTTSSHIQTPHTDTSSLPDEKKKKNIQPIRSHDVQRRELLLLNRAEKSTAHPNT